MLLQGAGDEIVNTSEISLARLLFSQAKRGIHINS